jgi:hypothetical protein
MKHVLWVQSRILDRGSTHHRRGCPPEPEACPNQSRQEGNQSMVCSEERQTSCVVLYPLVGPLNTLLCGRCLHSHRDKTLCSCNRNSKSNPNDVASTQMPLVAFRSCDDRSNFLHMAPQEFGVDLDQYASMPNKGEHLLR